MKNGTSHIQINLDVPLWSDGPVVVNQLNATILYAWLVMAVLVRVVIRISGWAFTSPQNPTADSIQRTCANRRRHDSID